ncbi:hypothetical protein ACGFJ7_13860 [Actinoplanes sp. NPDC048988]|uniref:hypothetical protein n=1 Tax=Actinoplanes sp. NPDC048988 TaxID=3363901 RepID=UPI0037127532
MLGGHTPTAAAPPDLRRESVLADLRAGVDALDHQLLELQGQRDRMQRLIAGVERDGHLSPMPPAMVSFYDRVEARAADETTRRVIRQERDFMSWRSTAVTCPSSRPWCTRSSPRPGWPTASTALIAPAVVEGDDIAARALLYTAGPWPAAAAITGCTVLLAGAALLGDLLKVPPRIQDLGLFGHVPDVAAADSTPMALLVLVGAGALMWLAGLVAVNRRDLVSGRPAPFGSFGPDPLGLSLATVEKVGRVRRLP